MRRPLSTYRLQLNTHFTFLDAAAIVDYLHDLGIDTLYASPIFKALPGSCHGYDVVDHAELNPELGGNDGFRALCTALHAHGMGLLMDVVPNHMCVATGENGWWNDVLENGPSSPYARFFDIDWTPPKPELADKVLLPVLGDQYGRVLENQELSVSYEDGAFMLHYWERRFPLAPRSLPVILDPVAARLRAELGVGHADVRELESVLTAIRNLPPRNETDPERIRERMREKEVVQRRLQTLTSHSATVREHLAQVLQELRGEKERPQSFDQMDALLAEQAYRLSHWRVAADEINYRRFFDINDLAAVRIEEPEVLEKVHRKAFELLATGCVTGLRIDHVDGLLDPVGYLQGLQDRARRETGDSIYVVVEKILMGDEHLPEAWPTAGTTGYEFLNIVGGAFVDRSAANRIVRAYRTTTGRTEPFEDLVYEAKKIILTTSMAAEIYVLARRLDRISEQHRFSQDFTGNALLAALTEVVACFPAYRSYIRQDATTVADDDAKRIHSALADAQRRNPTVDRSVFHFLGDVLLLRDPPGLPDDQRRERREFVARLQQLTGAVMAKGWEDTTHYRFAPLACLNEVGGGPDSFGVAPERMHDFLLDRRRHWPGALSATSTHDTKRGEDVRARIAVLSEIPKEWTAALRRWQQLNRRVRRQVAGHRAAQLLSAGEENLLYQTLIGTWPVSGASATSVPAELVDRIARYMVKALREAKERSSWINVDQAYEDGVIAFVHGILTPGPDNRFLVDFLTLQTRVARLAAWGSLAQLVIKMTAPGVPDFYQGTEWWDLSLVDPDNRRPVDYATRRQELQRVCAMSDPARQTRDLARELDEGRIKQAVMQRGLACRARNRELFEEGTYEPLVARSNAGLARHVLAFGRNHQALSAIMVVGRFFDSLCPDDATPVGEIWGDAVLPLPDTVSGETFRDAISGATVTVAPDRTLALASVFSTLPLAILEPT